ncbi:Hypothetical predicted protein, partial [Paramuricea clavata]
ASDSIQLENSLYRKCLTHDGAGNPPVGKACDPDDPNQEWRWIEHLILQNIGSGHCLEGFSTQPNFRMQECDFLSKQQHFTCIFNVIRGDTNICLDDSTLQMISGADTTVHESQCKWKIFGSSNDRSICNTTT